MPNKGIRKMQRVKINLNHPSLNFVKTLKLPQSSQIRGVLDGKLFLACILASNGEREKEKKKEQFSNDRWISREGSQLSAEENRLYVFDAQHPLPANAKNSNFRWAFWLKLIDRESKFHRVGSYFHQIGWKVRQTTSRGYSGNPA